MDHKLQDFLERPVMLVAAAPSAGGAALARVLGARLADDGRAIDVFISRAQWPRVFERLGGGDWLALTLCRPESYETYQVKGPVEAIAAPSEEEQRFSDAYIAMTGAHLAGLGVEVVQIAPWLHSDDLVRVRFQPRRLFEQTPGPGAGRPVGAPA